MPWSTLDLSTKDTGDKIMHRDPIDVEKRKQMFKTVSGPNGNFDVPEITEFGFEELPENERSPHRGGESDALKIMEAYLANKKKVITVSNPVLHFEQHIATDLFYY
jgi:hypothetical protein